MSTPIAMTASNGAVDGVDELFPAPAPAVLAPRDKSVAELEGPRRSAAPRSDEEPFWGYAEDWIWEAE